MLNESPVYPGTGYVKLPVEQQHKQVKIPECEYIFSRTRTNGTKKHDLHHIEDLYRLRYNLGKVYYEQD
jgi:hypothetical protein